MEDPFPPSSSSGASPVQLADYLDDLLKVTVPCSMDETLEIHLGLSKEYCFDLLKVDIKRPQRLRRFSSSGFWNHTWRMTIQRDGSIKVYLNRLISVNIDPSQIFHRPF
ncbi:hypothetical protein BVC80_1807g5 [Macleaya cordata]|uniref:Uncharacterized protein n=1 Tax=Macleaya cordata TaxID=56857 RepID=A0A200PXW3_MACCD|nr:hypothetical protein BVC80_1807g5 [Macleaya cordata]